ncbi:MAG: hypothetical protein KUG77_11055 [Nannocystaceae bacterium]|nr:hypothetical protein [Nannocystaceae bacterium]
MQLVTSVTGGALIEVNEGLFEGCVLLASFGGIAVINPSRIVLAGTGCLAPDNSVLPPTVVVTDDQLEVLASTTILNASLANPPTPLDDGTVLVPTTEIVNPTTAFWNYNVFDPQLGDIEPAAGLQFTGADFVSSSPTALNVPGHGVFMARSTAEVALLEADFDATLWTDDLGVGGELATVRARILGRNGTIFVGLDSDGCPGASEHCIIKYDGEGSREWTRPVHTYMYSGALASDGADGVFYGIATTTGFFVAHLDEEGDELSSELLTFEAPPSSFVRVAADGQGGVVLSLAIGTYDASGGGHISGDESVLLRLDSQLQEIWRVDGFGPGQSRGVALAYDGNGGLLIAGIRAGSTPPDLFAMEGQVWLGRANL